MCFCSFFEVPVKVNYFENSVLKLTNQALYMGSNTIRVKTRKKALRWKNKKVISFN